MATGRVESLHIYPIKSCRGIDVQTMEVDTVGPKFDRSWMLVDGSGNFLTQRTIRKLAQVSVSVRGRGITVDAEGMTQLIVDPDVHGQEINAKVWEDHVMSQSAGSEVDQWFSDFIKKKCHLVRMIADRRRNKPQISFTVSYADGYPFLLTNTASLDDLNERLDIPLPMNRFRPNIVVSGLPPFAEDAWTKIKIGSVVFSHFKPCARCVITTTDQATGKRGEEPLATLRTFRLQNGEIMFGQNMVHDKPGIIKVGDELNLL